MFPSPLFPACWLALHFGRSLLLHCFIIWKLEQSFCYKDFTDRRKNNYGGLTLAMVSWNLKSGSRVSGDSTENWASDRKLVVWGEKERRRINRIVSFKSLSNDLSFQDKSLSHSGISLLLWDHSDYKVHAQIFTSLIFSILVCSILSGKERNDLSSYWEETTPKALKATELPGRFVLLSNMHILMCTHVHTVPDADTKSCNHDCTHPKTTSLSPQHTFNVPKQSTALWLQSCGAPSVEEWLFFPSESN